MDSQILSRVQKDLQGVPIDWGSVAKERRPTDLGARVTKDLCLEIAQELNMDPASVRKLMESLGSMIRKRMIAGEFFGIPGVGVFYVKHRYNRKNSQTRQIEPHKAVPRFSFSAPLKAKIRNAPNKGTPNEQYKLKRKLTQTSASARRRSELPGGYYVTGSGALKGVGSPAGRSNPARERHTFPQIGFAGRLNEVATKARFRKAVKRAAKAAG